MESTNSIPQELGDFEIIRELGRGGMGIVYEARQKSLNRRVALKVLSSGLGLTAKAVMRFRREAEAAAKLHHTNIVPIYSTGEDRGVHYYAMELIDGPSLDQVIRHMRQVGEPEPTVNDAEESDVSESSEHLPDWVDETIAFEGQAPTATSQSQSTSAASLSGSAVASGTKYFDTVATMIADVADALDHAHGQGVIHRDIKPSNLLLGPDGRLSINDFGLARVLEQPGMTMSGEFVGSPLYMSPEQITAGRVPLDHRTDIYSLGATLYELLTLQPPFLGQTRDQVLSQILNKEPASTRKLNRKIPPDLDTICIKAIDKDRDRRYQSAGQLAKDLSAYVNRHAISARRIGWMGKAVKLARRNPAVTTLSFLLLLLAASLALVVRQNKVEALLRAKADTFEFIVSGELDEAEDSCTEAEELGASDIWLHRMRGHIAIYEDRLEDAREHFEEAKRLGDTDTPLACLNAILEFYSGQELEYFQAINRLLDVVPRDIDDKLYLGLAFVWTHPELACQYLDDVREAKRTSIAVKFSRGYASIWLAQDTMDDQIAVERVAMAISDLSAAHDAWSANQSVCGSLIVAHLTAAQIHNRLGGKDERNDHMRHAANLAGLIEAQSTNTEAVFAKYFLLTYQNKPIEAHAFLKKAMSRERLGQNYLSSIAIIEAFRNRNPGDAEQAYGQITEDSGQQIEQKVKDSKLAFLMLARLSVPRTSREIDELRIEFEDYLVRKRDSKEYSSFEQDWLVLHLLDADDNLAAQLARGSEGFFAAFDNPQQDNLQPICRFLADADPDPIQLEAECLKTRSRRTMATAYFAMGVQKLASGDKVEARRYFQECLDEHVFYFYVHQWARVFIERLDANDGWPESIDPTDGGD